jgi:hypothetical protein
MDTELKRRVGYLCFIPERTLVFPSKRHIHFQINSYFELLLRLIASQGGEVFRIAVRTATSLFVWVSPIQNLFHVHGRKEITKPSVRVAHPQSFRVEP